MKKILVVIMALMMVVFVAGCGNEEESQESDNEEVTSEENEDIPSLKLKKVVHKWKNSEGYEFKAVIKHTDWVKSDNDALVPTWSEICNFEDLPDAEPGTWGINNDGTTTYDSKNGGHTFSKTKDYTDVFYCLGEVSVKNITKNWEIAEDNPVSTSMEIDLSKKNWEVALDRDIKSGHILTKIFSPNEGEAQYEMRGVFDIDMDSNDWSSPFVFAHFDKSTPDNPQGAFRSELEDYIFTIHTYGDEDNTDFPTLKIVE